MDKVTIYLHGDKEDNFEKGEALGLTGEALNNFMYTAYEEEITYEVDLATGEAKAIAFNGRKIHG